MTTMNNMLTDIATQQQQTQVRMYLSCCRAVASFDVVPSADTKLTIKFPRRRCWRFTLNKKSDRKYWQMLNLGQFGRVAGGSLSTVISVLMDVQQRVLVGKTTKFPES